MGVEDRPAYLPRHREVHFAGATCFATFVPFDTVAGALFNYWEPSMGLDTRGKSIATVHLSHVDDRNPDGPLNLVVIQDYRIGKGRNRVDYYFGTFRGIPRGETKTREETKIFDSNVEHVHTRHHRVAGSELNALIRNAAKLDEPIPLSWNL